MHPKTPCLLTVTLLIACLALLSMSGCVSTPPGYVAREWSTTMRELGITPVFPPREDVQVGDIYMAPTVPEAEKATLDSKGYLPLGLWVGAAKTKDVAATFYSKRNSFPATSKNDSSQPRTTNASVFNDTDPQRLRLVGFPIFMSTTLTQGSLSGLIPTEAVGIIAAAGFTEGRRVNVSIPRAESYGLPAALVFDLITQGSESNAKGPRKWNVGNAGGVDPQDIDSYIPAEQRASLSKDPAWQANKYAYLRIMTEVFYARELDISVESSRGLGVSLEAKPAASLSAAQAPPSEEKPAADTATTPAKNTEGGGAAATPSAGTVQFQQPTPQQIASELNRQLDTATQRTTPGVGARFVSAGNSGVGLRVTFERPIAIGYRGMLLRVSEDGSVVGAGTLGSAVPTAAPPNKPN
jgi:hypothetical protein